MCQWWCQGGDGTSAIGGASRMLDPALVPVLVVLTRATGVARSGDSVSGGVGASYDASAGASCKDGAKAMEVSVLVVLVPVVVAVAVAVQVLVLMLVLAPVPVLVLVVVILVVPVPVVMLAVVPVLVPMLVRC